MRLESDCQSPVIASIRRAIGLQSHQKQATKLVARKIADVLTCLKILATRSDALNRQPISLMRNAIELQSNCNLCNRIAISLIVARRDRKRLQRLVGDWVEIEQRLMRLKCHYKIASYISPNRVSIELQSSCNRVSMAAIISIASCRVRFNRVSIVIPSPLCDGALSHA